MLDRSTVFAFQCLTFSFIFSLSLRPTISLIVRKPNFAMISRNSSATNIMKFTTYSGLPWKFLRNVSSCVAIPTGHVFRWQTRIMTQPIATSGVVAKPNSSAPNIQAIATSRPVNNLPSVSTRTRSRNLFNTNVWCASAKPSSHGKPVLRMLVLGAAPVPPSYPLIRIVSAFAFATPAAIVPTPASETNFTLMRASRLAFFKSKINSFKSSIE